MVKTIVFLVFLLVAALFTSHSRLSLANQPRFESSNEQRSIKNEDKSASQESIDDPCKGAKNRPEEVECFLKGVAKAERKMNALVDEYIFRFKRDRGSGVLADQERRYAKIHIANLQNTQRTWLIFRNENCKADQDLFETGSDAELGGVICRLDMTEERIKELNRIYRPK